MPVGPQTAAVVGLCPLPLPSLAPHPISGGQGEGSRNLKGSKCGGRVAILVSPLPCSLSLFCLTVHLCRGLASQNFFICPSASTLFELPWALCVIMDCAECSCCFNELLWVSAYLLLSLGPLCAFPNLSFSLCPPCSLLPHMHPQLQAVLCRLSSDQSLLKAGIPARGMDACSQARKGTRAWWQRE